MLEVVGRVVQGYAWAEDKEHCEEYGRMLQADPSKVSQRAKKRGLPQVGPLSTSPLLLTLSNKLTNGTEPLHELICP